MPKSLVVVSLYTVTVIVFSAGLIYIGIRGKEESESSNQPGPGYYIGAFVVASVFTLDGIITAVYIIIGYKYGQTDCINSVKKGLNCMRLFWGLCACIFGLVFVTMFGIQNCDDVDNRSEKCSYNENIGTNYILAMTALGLICFMFISLFCSWTIVYIDEDNWGGTSTLSESGLPRRTSSRRVDPMQSDVEDLRRTVNRLEQQNKELLDKINRREGSARTQTQDRENNHQSMPQSSLPLLDRLQTQVNLIARNQEDQMRNLEEQMRLMQSNARRSVAEVHRPSSSHVNPTAPPGINDGEEPPPSYSAVVNQH